MDAIKAAKFIEKIELPVLGVIENMSGMICPHCGGTIDLFSKGGGKKAAEDLGVSYLGAIPLDPEMVKAGDEGRPIILRHADSPTGKAVDAIMENLMHLANHEGNPLVHGQWDENCMTCHVKTRIDPKIAK